MDFQGRKLAAEAIGTFWLTFGGCGTAVIASGFPQIGVGLALTLIHLISIPVTNTSVNPARSTGPALFVGGWALRQLWLFWVAPLIGGAAGGAVYRWLSTEPSVAVTGEVPLTR
jgi:aquaporin Z